MSRGRHPSGETLADHDHQIVGPIRRDPCRHGSEVLVAEEFGQILLIEVQIDLLNASQDGKTGCPLLVSRETGWISLGNRWRLDRNGRHSRVRQHWLSYAPSG